LNTNGWVFAVAALLGLIAKEDVIAAFGALAACLAPMAFSGGSEDGIKEVIIMIEATGIGVAGLISFIAFNMLTIPCFAAVAAAKGGIGKGKFKWTLLFWIVTSYLVSTIVYTVGEWTWTIAIWAVVAAIVTVGIIMYNKIMDKKHQPLYRKK
jgi:ferrous iron transport protein B